MAVQVQEDSGPDLLLHWDDRHNSRTYLRDGIASVLVHGAVIALLIFLESLPDSPRRVPVIQVDLHRAVRLVAPHIQQLTQKEPTRGEIAKELNVEGLRSHSEVKASMPTPPPKPFHAPAASAPAPPQPKPPELTPESPKIEAEVRPPPNLLPQLGTPQAPPPRTQSAEPPKLPMETPGQSGVGLQRAPGQVRIPPPPRATVDEAIKSATRGQASGAGMTVGDEDQPPSISDTLRHPQSPASVQSSLQLLSDPQGVDFKPYLIRILATVRRNWLAVIPESAHMGRRGKVLLQFIIDRNGGVPKLVIAMPSGAEALDRAAVAGISASVPFPPLPSEFKGNEVRLQFAFSYNMK